MMYDSVGRKSPTSTPTARSPNIATTATTTSPAPPATPTSSTPTYLATQVDPNGNPTAASFASIRPATHADDQWTFQVYDAAQRLVQTIDGTGATTVYAYDGASRLTSTKTYANKLDVAHARRSQGRGDQPEPLDQSRSERPALVHDNLSAAGGGDDRRRQRVSVHRPRQHRLAGDLHRRPGSSRRRDGHRRPSPSRRSARSPWIRSASTAARTGWGANADAYCDHRFRPRAIVLSIRRPFQISGLSTTEATRFTITRTYRLAEWVGALFLSRQLRRRCRAGRRSSPRRSFREHAVIPILPTADAANDRVSRSFYDNDGRLIAAMDAAGGLTQFTYDKAGRKVRSSATPRRSRTTSRRRARSRRC